MCACRDGFYGITCEQSEFFSVGVKLFGQFYSEYVFQKCISYKFAGDAESVFFACFGVEFENETPDDSIILWDTVRINIGGHYDVATGAYTAPQDGIYQFQVQISCEKYFVEQQK